MVDSLGIPGWDKVDRLVTALLDLKGMSVSASQAETIKKLFALMSLTYDHWSSIPGSLR